MSYPDSIVNAWKSERLVYRAIEENEADRALLWECNQNDAVNSAMASHALFKPGSRKDTQFFFEFSKDAVIRHWACLPPAEPAADSSKEGADDGPQKEKAQPQPQPTPIGLVLLWNKTTGAEHHRSGMIGITMMAGYRGQGYGGEALNWLLDWGFMNAGFHRIGLDAFSYNPLALKLYRKTGFVEEGREREAILFQRKWHDVINFGMLESEWEKLRGYGEQPEEK
ncbi:acyl-CoA N-acyltransferase [Podospora appendiculata]|uniref:Acyl-CoA N-acyltransferase n=1 Tax=Podospora appendiculata TaxID=314037 RepID=A0AAE0X4L4_9PEZI|nr:acyl-CoA N-acyltransferase [Podospora appendiculata]